CDDHRFPPVGVDEPRPDREVIGIAREIETPHLPCAETPRETVPLRLSKAELVDDAANRERPLRALEAQRELYERAEVAFRGGGDEQPLVHISCFGVRYSPQRSHH